MHLRCNAKLVADLIKSYGPLFLKFQLMEFYNFEHDKNQSNLDYGQLKRFAAAKNYKLIWFAKRAVFHLTIGCYYLIHDSLMCLEKIDKQLNIIRSTFDQYPKWNQFCHLRIIEKSFSTENKIKTLFHIERTNSRLF